MSITLLAAVLAFAATDPPTSDAADIRSVAQAWQSSGVAYANTDSLAACRMPDGSVRLFATAKEGNRIDAFDASTGKFVASLGSRGDQPGQFERPNGIVTAEFGASRKLASRHPTSQAVLLVIERDNARVQAIWPTSLESAGIFGGDKLRRPYGGTVWSGPDGPVLYVTDTNVPPAETVKAFRLRTNGRSIEAEHVRTFGDADGPGAIRTAESIVVDPRRQRLLICDEEGRPPQVKEYTMDGKFTGRTFAAGLVQGDPEGIVVVDHGPKGFILLTDQRKAITIWHVFDRESFDHVCSFTGEPNIANTDGICLFTDPFKQFPTGALFAVHDDADIRAYSLGEVLGLIARHPGKAGLPSRADP
jgi:3-phytase